MSRERSPITGEPRHTRSVPLRPLRIALTGTATLLLLLVACTTVAAAAQRDTFLGSARAQHHEVRHFERDASARDEAAEHSVRHYSRRSSRPASPGDAHTMDHLPGGSAVPAGGATAASQHADLAALCPDATRPRPDDRHGRLERSVFLRGTDHFSARGARAPPS
jgi:hypothetical protein